MPRRTLKDRRKILSFRARASDQPSRVLLILTGLSAVIYFLLMTFFFERGNPLLFWALIVGEVFHLWMAFTYLHTVWDTNIRQERDDTFTPGVDVFITVAGEPVEVVEATVRGAKAMKYPNFEIHILNDGYVARKENWREIEALASRLKVNCITRTVPGGAKAGNINNGLKETSHPFVAVFDADHIPYPNFLAHTMGYFAKPKVAIVQTPQFYANRDENYVTGGAWEQQELFFGPISKGKNRTNSVFMCGTNMVVRRKALVAVGGMAEDNIAEDFFTSLFIHQRGWQSVYVPEVLAEGLAPEDFLSYYKQQFRWARGGLEVAFAHNPIFKRGLTWKQKLEYLSSASYHLNGPVVIMNAALPLVFFFTGLTPFRISTMALAAAFLPYIFLMIYTLQRSSNFGYTYRALSFSMGSFPIQLKALWAVLTRQKSSFAVTSKRKLEGNFIRLVTPHILYIILVIAGIFTAVFREGLSASVMNNIAWAMFNVAAFVPFIVAAMPAWGEVFEDQKSRRAMLPYDPVVHPARTSTGFSGKINYFINEHENDR